MIDERPARSVDTPEPRVVVATGLAAGTHVGDLIITRCLARGGMGDVYLARDTRLGRRVALKFVSIDSPTAISAFLAEARTTAQFSHPNIVAVYGAGEHEGRPYLVLEYLEGHDVATRIAERRPSLPEALRIGVAIAEALTEAHRHDVLHLDLTPMNVIIPSDGRVRVVDFGLARTTGPDATASTAFGGWGTPAYAAPEQWRGAEVSAATDVWALGVILFELCAGRLPYREASLDDHRIVVTSADPVPALDRFSHVPRDLVALVGSCLAKEAARRPSAADVVASLQRMLGAPRASAAQEHNPFRGLLPFGQQDAELFFGRDHEVDAFVERARHQPMLSVVGPSGAGKSSFVHAGVIPRLREQEAWLVLTLRPGARPFEALVERLSRGATHSLVRSGEIDSAVATGLTLGSIDATTRSGSTLVTTRPLAPSGDLALTLVQTDNTGEVLDADRLLENPRLLAAALRWLATTRRAKVMLVVDQLEELVTSEVDPDVRSRFMLALCTAADDPLDPVRVVLTIRDDFLGRLSTTPEVSAALANVTVLQTLGAEPLMEVMRRPVEAVGYSWEDPELVREMVADVAAAPGRLPLLQFAGAQLWELRDRTRRLLLRDAYVSMGGVAGALAHHADGVLAAMSPDDVALVRRLLLRLVTRERTRRAATRGELVQALGPAVEPVLQRLVDARLLVMTRPRGIDREARVELAHESLIRAWSTLAKWIEESREELVFLAQAEQAAELWRTRGCRRDELWRGDALRDAQRMLARCTDIPAIVGRFMEASAALQRARVRRRRLTLGTIVGTLAVIAASSVAVAVVIADKEREAREQGREARAQRADAQAQRGVAELRRAETLTESARAALGDGEFLEARAKLRTSLEQRDSLGARALWWQLEAEPLLWSTEIGTFGTTLAHSADGELIATGCQETAVCLFEASTGRLRRLLRGHAEKVAALAFGPDGEQLATGDWGNEIRTWDLRTGRTVLRMTGHTDRIEALAFSPDGQRLASAARDRTARIWDPITGAQRLVLDGHTGGISSVAFSVDGKHLVTGSEDKTVRIWDAASGHEIHVLEGHGGAVESVVFAPHGTQLASAGNDGTVRLWDVETGRESAVLRGHTAGVRGVAWSGDGRMLASASYDKTIGLWDPSTGKLLRRLAGHDSSVRVVQFDPSGTRIASAGYDRTLRYWDARVEQRRPVVEGHAGAVRGVVFSPDGGRLATGGFDGTVRVWDANSGDQLTVLGGQADAIYGVSWSPDGSQLASAGADGDVRVWNMAAGALDRVLHGHLGPVYDVTFSADGRWLASGSRDGTVRTWDAATGREAQVFSGHEHLVWDVAFAPDSTTIASASWDRTARVWSLAAKRRSAGAGRQSSPLGAPAVTRTLGGHGGPVYGVVFGPDGRNVVTTGADAALRNFDLHSGDVEVVAQLGGRAGVPAYHPSGGRIAVPMADGSVRVVDLHGAPTMVLPGHSNQATVVAYEPSGGKIATVGDDGTLRVWQADDGRPYWRAPVLLQTPPRLLTHRGWLGLADATQAEPSEAWRSAVEQHGVTASEHPAAGLLCLLVGDTRVELWRGDDRLVTREVDAAAQVLAVRRGCLVRTATTVELVQIPPAPSIVLLNESASAIDGNEDVTLVGLDDEVIVFDASGRERERIPADVGITALAEIDGEIVVGYRDGTLDVLGGVAAGRTFEHVAPSRPTRIVAGTAGTIIVGFADGSLGIWSVADGTRLASARLHGRLAHLLVQDHKLYAATDLGRWLAWDLRAFDLDRCELLAELWRTVAVVWEDGRPVVRAPPGDHECSRG